MFRLVCGLLAKKTGAAPVRRKVLKRVPRRTNTARSKATPTPTTAVAPVSPDQALAPSSELTARRLSYRLATAVATVVVPPTANTVLEGMKQLITPASRPAGDDREAPQVMEEYYTTRKGPLFATAVIAGTNAVKQASTLIPFCHPVAVQKCSFTFRRRLIADGLRPSALPHRVVLRKRAVPPPTPPSKPAYSVLYCFCTVATEELKNGVEMEALTGATVASMTLYDMLKSLPGAQEDGLGLGEAFVLAKRGGRSDFVKLLMSDTARAATTAPETASTDTAVAEPEAAAEETTSGTVVRKLPQLDATATPAGDSGAWWRSSKHERRLQELYPRRKYGPGARVAEAVPTVERTDDAARAPRTTTPRPGSGTTARARPRHVAAVARTAAHTENDDAHDDDAEDDDAAEDKDDAVGTGRVGNRVGKTRETKSPVQVQRVRRPARPVAEVADDDDNDDSDAETTTTAAQERVTETRTGLRRVRRSGTAVEGVGQGSRLRRTPVDPVPRRPSPHEHAYAGEDEDDVAPDDDDDDDVMGHEEEEDEDVAQQEVSPRRRGGAEMHPVHHDTWDGQTTVVDAAPMSRAVAQKKMRRKGAARR